jgi:hypothetical protein
MSLNEFREAIARVADKLPVPHPSLYREYEYKKFGLDPIFENEMDDECVE